MAENSAVLKAFEFLEQGIITLPCKKAENHPFLRNHNKITFLENFEYWNNLKEAGQENEFIEGLVLARTAKEKTGEVLFILDFDKHELKDRALELFPECPAYFGSKGIKLFTWIKGEIPKDWLEICKFSDKEGKLSLELLHEGKVFGTHEKTGKPYTCERDCKVPVLEWSDLKERIEKISEESGLSCRKLGIGEEEALFSDLKTIVLEELVQGSKADKREVTELIVEHIKKTEHIKVIKSDEKPVFYYYDRAEGIYKPEGKTLIREICRKVFGKEYQGNLINEVIDKLEVDCGTTAEEFLDKEPALELVPLKNGILDTKTGEILPFSPDIYFFGRLPIAYEKGADCPETRAFFEEVLGGNKEAVLGIQELFGYCLRRRYSPSQRACLFIGEGSNGKGVTIRLLESFIGQGNYTGQSLEGLLEDKHSRIELHKRFLNVCGDIPAGYIKNPEVLKKLRGEDTITGRELFKNYIDFKSYAKLVFSCNALPTTGDYSDGFMRSWAIWEFPLKYVSEKEFSGAPNERIKNPTIEDKLQAELPGVLNWALEGLERLLKQGDFSHAKRTEEIREYWRAKTRSFETFFSECYEIEAGTETTVSELNLEYTIWAKKAGILRKSSPKEIRNFLEGLGAENTRNSSGTCRVWAGVKRKSDKSDKTDALFKKSYIEHHREVFKTASVLSVLSEKSKDLKRFTKETLFGNIDIETADKDQISKAFEYLYQKGFIRHDKGEYYIFEKSFSENNSEISPNKEKEE